MTTRLPESHCLACGARMTAASTVGEDYEPRPGDYTLCLVCSHLMVFTDDMHVRDPTRAEIEEATNDPEMWETLHFVRAYQHRHRKVN